MSYLSFSSNYFDKAVERFRVFLQEESGRSVSRTLWKELQEVKRN